MSAELVMFGRAGRATRHEPHGWLDTLGQVVDRWTLHPSHGDLDASMFVYVVALASQLHTGAVRCVLLVGRVNHAISSEARALELPIWLAWDVRVLAPIRADNHDRAREVTRHLARWAVEGNLPISPATTEDALLWSTAAYAAGCALEPGIHHRAPATAGAR